MKLTLVNPPLYGAPTPPLSAVLLGTVAEAHGHTVRIVDFNVWPVFDRDRMVAAVLADNPQAVGVSCWGNATPFCLWLAEAIRKAAPGVWLIVGGPMVRPGWSRFDRLLASFDLLVEGEGEAVLPGLLAGLAGRRPDRAPGTAGRLVRAETPDIAAVPLPRWSLLGDLTPYRTPGGGLQLPIQASRGCAYNCSFCSVREFWGAVRVRDPAAVVREIEAALTDYGADTLLFYDDNFTGKPDWLRALLGRFRSDLPRFRWVASTRIDLVPPELAVELAEHGAVNLFFGIESASKRIRTLYRKNFRIDVLDALRQVGQAGIAAEVSLVFGSPEEGPDVMAANLDFMDGCLDAGVSYIHTHVLFPIPDTTLARRHEGAIIANPYPKVTQASLAGTPADYFDFLSDHRDLCLDFWMFAPRDMTLDRFFEGFFEATFRKHRFTGLPPVPQQPHQQPHQQPRTPAHG